MLDLDKDKIIETLRDDEQYYGDFGKQFLSNSNIYSLINDPKAFNTPVEPNIHLLMGRAFHTMVLEPHKFTDEAFPVVDASSRLTNIYKTAEKENGEMMLLKNDMIQLNEMKRTIDNNELIQSILKGENVSYEEPAFGEVEGEIWKGKADCLNHDEKLIVDVKTTSDLNKFHLSAKRYNYDSQAYIYKQLFGYDMVFVVIDKKTKALGFYDCSENFYRTGKSKVEQAVYAYRMFYKDQENDFDWSNYLKTETL